MLSLIIAVLATAALVATAVHLYRSESNRSLRRWIVVGNAFAIVAIWAQFAQQTIDAMDARQQHAESEKKIDRLIEQNGLSASELSALRAQNGQLLVEQRALRDQNQQLEERLRPVIRAAESKHPGVGESEAVSRLLAEIEKRNPRLALLPERTLREDAEDGRKKTTYFFESSYPAVIRGARITLNFDHSIQRAEVKAPNTLPFADNLKVEFPRPRTVVVRANVLGEAGQISVTVFSRVPVNLLGHHLQP